MKKKRKIVFLVPPGANMFDFASATQVFHEAISLGLNAEIIFCCFEKNVYASTGIPLGKIQLFTKVNLNKEDILFLVSADIKKILDDIIKPSKELLKWINENYNKGVVICGLCTGVFLLAQSGLLNGRNCTTHWKYTELMQEKYPLAIVQSNLIFVEDEGLITSAGASSGVDVSLHILSKLKDDYFTATVSRELVIYNRSNGNNEDQSPILNYRQHMNINIHKAQNHICEHLNIKLNLTDLANIALMSERNFTRVFKKETGITVYTYLSEIRKIKIEELIKSKHYSREQIAAKCGLKSARQISRILAE